MATLARGTMTVVLFLALAPRQASADEKCKRGEFTQVEVVQKVKKNTYEVQDMSRQHVLLVTKRNVSGQGYICLCATEGPNMEMKDQNGFAVSVPSLKDVGVPKDDCVKWSGF